MAAPARRMALALAMTLICGLAQAQSSRAPRHPPSPPPRQEAPPAPPQAAEPPPPYEPQLLRLAEIMGALSYLRDLCGDKDGNLWRSRMSALLEAEAQTETRKERLAGAFNRGYRGFETTYRTCTANAELVIHRYLDEGGRLARDVQNRFGGG